jgi:hypothetical protein
LEDAMLEPRFDMDLFMRACGWHPWTSRQDPGNRGETVLWWNRECMTFGRIGDRFFYDDADDWERMEAFFAQYPEAEIIGVWHTRPMTPDQPRQGYLTVHTRLTAPWPTACDEAFDLMIRWGCYDEEDRPEVRTAYERAAKSRSKATRGERQALK